MLSPRHGFLFENFAAGIGERDVASRLARDGGWGLFVEVGDGSGFGPEAFGERVVVEVEFAVVDRGDKAKIKVNNRHLVIGC